MRLPGTFWCNQQFLGWHCMKKKMTTITLNGFVCYLMRKGVIVALDV
jgi:hypothetical protein